VAAERWEDQVGSVADEAARLLESLRRSAETAATPSPAGEASTAPPTDDGPDAVPAAPAAPHDPFCTWCPLCRGAAVVRSLSPETLARLADLATLAASVLTDLASSRPGPGPAPDAASDDAGRDPASGPAPTPRRRPRRPAPAKARPIPVSDADDPQEAPRG
jgi:hypothetical protein